MDAMAPGADSVEQVPATRFWLALAGVCALIALDYRSAVHGEFLGDARFLILENQFLTLERLWDNIAHDYFWSSSGNSLPYWRPLTKAQWVIERSVFGPTAHGFHAVQLAWFAFGAVGVALLGRRLTGDPWLGVTAALLWALSPLALEPVHLIMARSDVVAATCSVWCLLLFDRWSTDGRLLDGLGCAAFAILALASKEVAVVLAPLGFAMAVARRPAPLSREHVRAALRRSAPLWALVVLYLVARGQVVHGGATIDWSVSRWSSILGTYGWNLIPLRLDSGLRFLSEAEVAHVSNWLRVAFTLTVTATVVAWAVRRRAWTALWLVAWAAAMLAPVTVAAHLNVPTGWEKLPVADRWAFHAVAPVALLTVTLCARTRWSRRALLLAVAVWTPASVLLHAPDHRLFASEHAYLVKEELDYQDTPEAFRTQHDRCRAADREAVALVRGGDARGAVPVFERAQAECGVTPKRSMNLLAGYIQLEQWEKARATANRLEAPDDARSYARLAVMLGRLDLHEQKFARARRYFDDAAARGYSGCELPGYRGQVELAARAFDAAAAHFERAAACFGPTVQGARAHLGRAAAQRAAGNSAGAAAAVTAAKRVPLAPGERAAIEALARQLRLSTAAAP